MQSQFSGSTKRAVRGVMWTYASYYSGKLLVFLSTVVLARLLSQDDFGVAGYALVLISSLDVLSNLGVGQALIYHREDPDVADTAFWLGFGISLGLLAVTWFGAPLAGEFFNDPRAIPVTRALSFTFPLSSLGYVHDMLLRKGLSFGRKFVPDLSKSLGKGIFAIIFASLGFGAWSLIYSQLVGEVIAAIVYWVVVPWRPKLNFVFDMAKTLLQYGLNIVAVNALSVLFSNADALLIGRFLGAATLGVYTLAFRIPDMLVMQFNSLVSKVIFPFYAKMRENAETFQRGFLYTTKYTTLATIPMGVGVAVISKPLVLIFFSEKWVDAIPVMQALALYSVVSSLVYNAGDVYKAQGRPEILTRLTFLEGALLIPTLYFAIVMQGTVIAVAWARVGVAVVLSVVDLTIACRMLNISLFDLVKTIGPSIVSSALMALVVVILLFNLSAFSSIVQLVLGMLTGGMVYLGSLWVLQRDVISEGLLIFKKALTR